jgi:hypothetical protein
VSEYFFSGRSLTKQIQINEVINYQVSSCAGYSSGAYIVKTDGKKYFSEIKAMIFRND